MNLKHSILLPGMFDDYVRCLDAIELSWSRL